MQNFKIIGSPASIEIYWKQGSNDFQKCKGSYHRVNFLENHCTIASIIFNGATGSKSFELFGPVWKMWNSSQKEWDMSKQKDISSVVK